jgi:hypothetical protein
LLNLVDPREVETNGGCTLNVEQLTSLMASIKLCHSIEHLIHIAKLQMLLLLIKLLPLKSGNQFVAKIEIRLIPSYVNFLQLQRV